MSYDGVRKQVDKQKTVNQENWQQTSEREINKKLQQKSVKMERPNTMRSSLVSDYFSDVMKESGGPASDVFREIYRNVMDNRIFNNLKQQLNEMIESENSLISIEQFRKIFYTFFKGEFKVSILYEKLLPFITVWEYAGDVYDELSQVQDESQAEKRVSVQKLTIFIDSFNFYPVKVDKIHFKN